MLALNMIDYIGDTYGVNTVISGGDLVAGSDLSKVGAQKIMDTYYKNGLLANSKGHALYVMGNHDANISAGSANMLSDSYLYDATVKNLVTSGKAVLDNSGIAECTFCNANIQTGNVALRTKHLSD